MGAAPGSAPSTAPQPSAGGEAGSSSAGCLATGAVPFVSYAGYYNEAFGSNIAALSGTLRRPRVPFSHIDALARDVRDVGVAFVEGEVLKLYHLEVCDERNLNLCVAYVGLATVGRPVAGFELARPKPRGGLQASSTRWDR